MREGRAASRGGVRSGVTLVELMLGLMALGVVWCVLFAVRCPLSGPPRVQCPSSVAPHAPGGYATRSHSDWGLQARLDWLGYTVNVPPRYEGRLLSDHGYWRANTRSDAIFTSKFDGRGVATFQQVDPPFSSVRPRSLGAAIAPGEVVTLLSPQTRGDCCWVIGQYRQSGERDLTGPIQFELLTSDTSRRSGRDTSPVAALSAGAPRLLVLPALTGGNWVSEGARRGHWAGTIASAGYLLCWEDPSEGGDWDYQDLVVLAAGIAPTVGESPSTGQGATPPRTPPSRAPAPPGS